MRRITINVPDEIAVKAQRAVDEGSAESLSGYFCALAKREPDWVLAREAVEELIAQSEPITRESMEWALDSLGLAPELANEFELQPVERELAYA